MGIQGSGGLAPSFCEGSEASCFADSSDASRNARNLYRAEIDDTFLIDRQGFVRYEWSAYEAPLTEDDNAERVDEWVRGLVAETPADATP
jgi:hypothetical protein